MADSSLDAKMRKALFARKERQILRKLPDPPSSELLDFTSNDYLSLSTHPSLRAHFLSRLSAAPNVLGSGGSRLLVNGQAHADFEDRLAKFFNAPSALLFNSGFDANVGFFACVPQPGDVIVHDEYIHASVHDGIRAARGRYTAMSFAHNHIPSLRQKLSHLLQRRPEFATAEASVFVAVESLYSMDGTLAPLCDIVDLVEELFPRGNGYVVVDEAHATGIYGPQGRGLVAHLGLEKRVFARLHTFGKALAATGGSFLSQLHS
jgi:8-amino-7-oxononanoate synthase